MTYIISDTHFDHKNIIKYTNRPFESVEEMNKKMINNWNNTVDKSDKVFMLGDFAFANQDRVKELVSQLNGLIVLVMGNHDRHRTASWWSECGFFQVVEYPIIYKDFFILSHEPVLMNDSMPYVNLHGHKHHIELKPSYYYNVSVELHDYKPIELETLLQKLKEESDE